MSRVRARGRRSGYSETAAGGRLLVLAGQTPDQSLVDAGEGFIAQWESALRNLLRALRNAGGTPGDLLHLRIFVTDLQAYIAAREELASRFRAALEDHCPATTLIEVGNLLGGGLVEIEGLAVASAGAASAASRTPEESREAVIRLRLAPSDARYAGGLVAGSKAMEIFADLETELALREGGDEGLCVAYDMVEFLEPLRVGDFVEGRARVVWRGRSSRRITAEIFKLMEVDDAGVLLPQDGPRVAARASATIVVGRTPRDTSGSR